MLTLVSAKACSASPFTLYSQFPLYAKDAEGRKWSCAISRKPTFRTRHCVDANLLIISVKYVFVYVPQSTVNHMWSAALQVTRMYLHYLCNSQFHCLGTSFRLNSSGTRAVIHERSWRLRVTRSLCIVAINFMRVQRTV